MKECDVCGAVEYSRWDRFKQWASLVPWRLKRKVKGYFLTEEQKRWRNTVERLEVEHFQKDLRDMYEEERAKAFSQMRIKPTDGRDWKSGPRATPPERYDG